MEARMTKGGILLVVCVAMIAWLACSDSTGPLGEHQLQVQVRALDGPALAAPDPAPATSIPALAPGIESIEIEEVFLVLGGLRLETEGTDHTVDWFFEESVVLTLNLTGDPTLAFDAEVPPGTYKELEVSIDKLEIGHPTEQGLITQWPTLADASIHVWGTALRDAVPENFLFTAPLDIDLELEFDAPLVVSHDEESVTVVSLTLDTSRWFLTEEGERLDPTDPEDRSDIEAAITRSIEIDEDAD
jgi:hypothetical protein